MDKTIEEQIMDLLKGNSAEIKIANKKIDDLSENVKKLEITMNNFGEILKKFTLG